jgi:transcription-repair coupling factor (superfamily II helicase)
VIIDEEQHFGAAEKAALSALHDHGHTLWMSATPIPRTLAAGLAGLRDVSVITTPPVRRVPVVTRLAPLSDAAMAAALLRERRRRGQSFVVCPRIQDLDAMLARVGSVAPELRIVCLHGKLPANELDERMMSFVEGRADVLLATNIVESGLDIPRANTILVCRPEKFGLAQLHQLRGRVGRGGTRAFAYFLTDVATGRSEKRLEALKEFDRPGAGLAISARDLDLRGGGDLLSDRQSGHLQVFGPLLSSHLLKVSLAADDAGAAGLWVPELNVPIPELLPADYAQSEAVRLEIYGRAARCISEEDLSELEDETIRRLGKPPAAARDFFSFVRLRIRCRQSGIIRLDVGPQAVAATLLPGRLKKLRTRKLQRDGYRVVLADHGGKETSERLAAFFEALDA